VVYQPAIRIAGISIHQVLPEILLEYDPVADVQARGIVHEDGRVATIHHGGDAGDDRPAVQPAFDAGFRESAAKGDHALVADRPYAVAVVDVDDRGVAALALDGDVVERNLDRPRNGEGSWRNVNPAAPRCPGSLDRRLHRIGDVVAGVDLKVVRRYVAEI